MSDVDQWLSDFESALSSGDSAAAAALFHEESFWRDLVAFTWNLKTVEGPDEIEAMLDAQLEHMQPSGWHTTEPPDTADGITTAWIAFETAAGRGNGLLRLRDGKAWTLLTALYELKGHEEPKGTHRPQGRRARRRPRPRDVARGAQQEAETLGYSEQPEVVIVGGGQGAIGLGARLRQLGVPTIICERNERPGDSLAPALQVAVPARPGLVRPPAVHQVPRELAGVLAQGQDRRLARDVHAGHGAQLLGLDEVKSATFDEDDGEWVVQVERDGQAITLRPQPARAGHRHELASRTCR